MTSFSNFWLCNFDLKPLTQNHVCLGAGCQATVDAAKGIDSKTFRQFTFGLYNLLCPRPFIVRRPSKSCCLSILHQNTKHCNVTSPEIMTSPNEIIRDKQLLCLDLIC